MAYNVNQCFITVFEAFKEEEVRFNWTLIVTVLAIWSASLLQFTLVLTASKGKKGRAGFHTEVNITYTARYYHCNY